MAFLYDLVDTWNAGGTTFEAFKIDVTDTASAAVSKLVSCKINGNDRFWVDKAGNAYFAGDISLGTTASNVSLEINGGIRVRGGSPGAAGANNNGYAFRGSGDNDSGMFSSADGQLEFYTNNSERVRVTGAGIVAVNTISPSAAAQLDVSSTTRGFLPPRMTTAQRDAISTPPDGLILYNATTSKLQVRAGGAWVDLH
jgi:hypothetical protein